MNAVAEGRPIGRTTLFAIFTLSGFSGLIYESIWSHYLKLFLGHAAYAQTLVLTVFMGGMALGAWLAARRSPRLHNLLLTYALVEGITGAIALAFHPIYLGSTGFMFDTVIPALDSPATINFAKWTIATLLILPQSVLLGSTFPLISGAIVRRFPDHPGTTLAMLYFTNCLGAAIGVLISGFLLIDWIGLPGTVIAAGIVNLAIAAFVWRRAGNEPAPAPALPAATREDVQLARCVLLAACLSGVAAFIYEIAWIRMLSLVLGSSTHAFELMLSAFILGLAFGGWWIRRRIDSLSQPFAALALMFAAMAVLAACTLPAYGYTFEVIGAAVRNFPKTNAGYGQFNLVSHGVAALVMIPTTFIAGMTLPVMTHALLRRADERAIGRVYASNTIGAIVGVLLAVHVLLPTVGVKGTVVAGAALQLGIAGLFLWCQPAAAQLPRVRFAMAACLALVALITLFVRPDPMRMASGVYRHGQTRLPDDMQVVFLRDGKTATISLTRQGDVISIATNGKPDASVNMGSSGGPTGDEITMVMAAALPLAMHHAPRQVANIGLGSGLTSSTLLAAPQVERLDSIEIEPMMARGARLGFGPRIRRLFEDPRSHLHFEDAKTFFSAGHRRYDVIISEPSNPWVSGVASLFSDEFYAQVVHYLNPDGILVQWIQIYETDITVVASILKALGSHFDDYVVYSTDDSNILIVAAPHGRLPPANRDLLAIPTLGDELRSVGIRSMGDIGIRRIVDKHLFHPFVSAMPVPANSDFHPYVDLNASRLRFLHRDALAIVELGMQPFALADIFAQPLASPVSDSQISARFFTRHRMAIDARSILNAVTMSEAALAPPDMRASIESLLIISADCQDETTRSSWLDAVHTLHARTTPYLTTAERAPLWQAVRERGCARTLAAGEAAWYGLLEAAGRGDTGAIATQGERLFTGTLPRLSGKQVLEALIGTAAAKIAIGRADEARALLQAYLPDLQNPGDFALALRIVVSLAHSTPSL